MPHVRANGLNHYYEEHGQGEPLLLMAPTGWPGSVWDLEQVPVLSQHFRVITYDQRGVGLSDGPDETFTTRDMAADALDLLRAIDALPAHVFGFSMGGRIAQHMALDQPGALRTLVQAASAIGHPGGRAGIPLDVAYAFATLSPDEFWWDHLTRDFPFSPPFRERHPEKIRVLADTIQARQPSVKLYLRHIIARGNHHVGERLRDIRTPTLVLVGENDRVSSGSGDHVAESRELAHLIPSAEMQTVPNAQHLFPWEAPEATNAPLLEFLAKHRV